MAKRRTPPPLERGGRPAPLVRPTDQRRSSSRRGRDLKPPKKRSRTARNPVVIVLSFLFLMVMLGLVGAGIAVTWADQMLRAEGPLTQAVGVIIEPGTSVAVIGRNLESSGVISNRFVFRAAAIRSGAATRLQAGEYKIDAGSSMAQVLDTLASGKVVRHKITVPEGLSSAQVVSLLEDNNVLTGEIDSIPDEGSLLPETYIFTRGLSRARMIALMQDAMEDAKAEIWAGRDQGIPIDSPDDMVVLASIVEKETGLDGERGRVAAVFVNRLNKPQRLESDPTILYGLYGGDAWSRLRGGITQSEKDRPNTYNTYQINGLPPGPIANPGRAALEAVANPPTTNEFFFVADGTGGHDFSVTYEEHLRKVARLRAIERSRSTGSTTQ
ncbi:MAG: endolytic transglycosylase MltG [Pseudomonadota bacterium]